MTLHTVINMNIILLSKKKLNFQRWMYVACINKLYRHTFWQLWYASFSTLHTFHNYCILDLILMLWKCWKIQSSGFPRWFIVVQRCILFSALKRVNCTKGPLFEQTWIPFTQTCFVWYCSYIIVSQICKSVSVPKIHSPNITKL